MLKLLKMVSKLIGYMILGGLTVMLVSYAIHKLKANSVTESVSLENDYKPEHYYVVPLSELAKRQSMNGISRIYNDSGNPIAFNIVAHDGAIYWGGTDWMMSSTVDLIWGTDDLWKP